MTRRSFFALCLFIGLPSRANPLDGARLWDNS